MSLISDVMEGPILGTLSAVGSFFAKNFKWIVLLLLLAAIWFGGVYYQKQKDIVTMNRMQTDFRNQEAKRAQDIQNRITEIERNANTLVDQARQDQHNANQSAQGILDNYNLLKEDRKKQIRDLTNKLQGLLKNGKGNQQEIDALRSELKGLETTCALSPDAVATINKLVDNYAGVSK